jgi:hypothetical protein
MIVSVAQILTTGILEQQRNLARGVLKIVISQMSSQKLTLRCGYRN